MNLPPNTPKADNDPPVEADVGAYYGPGRASTIFYDALESALRPIESEIAFYKTLTPKADARILEIGCGTGRIAGPLAQAGHTVVGIDLSPAMLAQADAKKAALSEPVAARIDYRTGDARTLDLGETFDLVLAPYRVFNHLLTPADQGAFLAALRNHASPDGLIVFDTNQPSEWHMQSDYKTWPEQSFALTGHDLILEYRIAHLQFDRVAQTVTCDVRFTLVNQTGGLVRRHTDRLAFRWAEPAEIRAMLDQNGLRLLAEYRDFDRAPPTEIGDRVWVVKIA